MSETLILQIQGLYTNPNQLGHTAPLGALNTADDIVIDRDQIAESRRGQNKYGLLTDIPDKEFSYRTDLLVHVGNKMAFDSNDNGTFTYYSGEFDNLNALAKVRSLEASGNFYLTTLTGVKKLDNVLSQFQAAGGIQALFGTATLSNPGFMSDQVQIAYRMIWGYTDANGNEIIGVPSQRLIVVNDTGNTADVTLTWYIPSGVTTSYFYRVYRSGESAGVDFPPDDELQQVKEGNPDSTDISNGYFTFTDIVPNGLRGASLYTDPSQEGIGNANYPPPLSIDMALFRNVAWYFNTKSQQRYTFSLISVGDNTTGGQFGFQTNNGTTHTSTTIDGLTKKASVIIQDLTYTADTAGVAGNDITITYTGGGTAGAEVVTVSASNISVQIQNAVSTATQVKAAVDGFPAAAALVDVTISGTGGNAQDTIATTFLEDGFDTTFLNVGMRVVGTGVQANTTIQTIASISSITVSPATTASATVPLEFQDAFRINSMTYWAASSADYPNRQFEAVLTGTPGENIEETALNLVAAIDLDPNNSLVYAYYVSQSNELPGKILIQERGIGANSFSLTSTNGSSFSPILQNEGSSNISDNDARQNGVYFSKVQQPEAVPILNFLAVGSSNYAILRAIAIRDSIFIFKEVEGIFRITGTDSSNFQVSLFDSSARIRAPETAVVLNNGVFTYSDQGIINVTENGVQILSRPIESTLLEITSDLFPNFEPNAFGVSYETDRKYFLFCMDNPNEVYPNQAFVYNTMTNTWTRWLMRRSCGLVLPRDNKMYMGNPDNLYIYKERKNFDRTDYADNEFPVSIVAYSGNQVTLSVSSIIDSSTFETSSGWTLNDNGISITFNGRCNILSGSDYGIVIDNTVTLSAGDEIFFDLSYSFTGGATGVQLYAFLGNTNDFSTSGNTRAGLFINTDGTGNHVSLQSDFGLIGDQPSLPDTLYNFKFLINSDGTLSIYYKLATDIDYTLVGTDEIQGNGGSVSWIGRPVYSYFINEEDFGGRPTLTIDNYAVVESSSVSSTQDLEPGDMLKQGGLEAIIEEVVNSSTVLVNLENSWALSTATVFQAILNNIVWIPNTTDNPGILKHYSECTVFFREATFTTVDVGFQTDIIDSFDTVTLDTPPSQGWGLFSWGEEPWGIGGGEPFSIRTYVPREKTRASWLNFQVTNREAYSSFALAGVSTQFNPMSSRQR